MTGVIEYEVESWHRLDETNSATVLVDIPSSAVSTSTSAVQRDGFVDLRAYVDDESTSSMLGRVNYVFSLNYKRLSEVMLVTRPTVYSWLDGGVISEWSKQERLSVLYSISNYWWGKAGMAMEPEMRKFPIGGAGKCIDELILEESLDIWRLVSALDALGDIALFIEHKKPSLATRLKQKGLRRKSAAAVNRDLR